MHLWQITDKGTKIVATITATANPDVAKPKIGIGATADIRCFFVAVTKQQRCFLIFSFTHENRRARNAGQGAGISNMISMMM